MVQGLGIDAQIQIGKPVGQGAFATVYEGVWQGLAVAVKTILFSGTQVVMGEGGTGRREVLPRERAVTEAAVALSVDHPNVVGALSAVTSQDSHNSTWVMKTSLVRLSTLLQTPLFEYHTHM